MDDFLIYFNEQWLEYFNNGILELNDINIKFRTNNSLENFNRKFKQYFQKKTNVNIINYVDILAEEVVFHENYLIEENRKPLKLISQNKLKGNYTKKIKKITEFYEEISKDILEYDLADNNEKENFETENKNNENIKDNNL